MNPTPPPPLRIVLDTDACNEVDDQFALAHLCLSPARVRLEAVYAAPFHNARSTGPADGMEKSYHEIHRVLALLAAAQGGTAIPACSKTATATAAAAKGGARPPGVLSAPFPPPVFRGATAYLAPGARPVESEAALDLIARALDPAATAPLHVVGIAAATNLATALLLAPEIASRIRLVWLGGHPLTWPDAGEFNLRQDIPAAQILLDSAAPLVLIPCKNVAEHLRATLPELRENLLGDGAGNNNNNNNDDNNNGAPAGAGLRPFLYQRFADYLRCKNLASKPLWDVAASAMIINPAWVPLRPASAPRVADGPRWETPPPPRHTIHVATDVDRDAILADLFQKLNAVP
jgi:inosine-uridine nucleoside N-ribohydrolase